MTWPVISAQADAILRGFRPETHTMQINHCKARDELVALKYISWYPPIFGSSVQYEITDLGRAYVTTGIKHNPPVQP